MKVFYKQNSKNEDWKLMIIITSNLINTEFFGYYFAF